MDKYKKKESWKSIVSIILVVLLTFGIFAGFSVLFRKESKSSGNNVKVESCMDTFVNTKLADYTKLDFEFAGKGFLNADGILYDDGSPFYSTEFISLEGYNEMIIKVNLSFMSDTVTITLPDEAGGGSEVVPPLFCTCVVDESSTVELTISELDSSVVAIFGEYTFISIKVPEGADPIPMNKVSLAVYEKAKDVLEIWAK